MKVLVACEYSGVVREAFRKLGHAAVSADLLQTELPGPHYTGNVLDILDRGWDLMIAHPPCTYLTVTGNKWFKPEFKERFPYRQQQREEAVIFFMTLANTRIPKIAIENPVGVMSTLYRKPDQIIQPWQFGDKAIKKTCLWLEGLPHLRPTKIVEPEFKMYNSKNHKSGKSKYPILWTKKTNWKERSKTFQGIADAMAVQWGNELGL